MATLSLNKPVIRKTTTPLIAPKKKEYIVNTKSSSSGVDPNSFFKKPNKAKVVLSTQQKMKKTLNWLCKRFPKAFNRGKPKPLMVGIRQTVMSDTKVIQSHIKPQLIKRALCFYTSAIKYKQSIVNSSKRIDLEGNPVGEVLDGDKEHAAQAINAIEERMEKSKEKND